MRLVPLLAATAATLALASPAFATSDPYAGLAAMKQLNLIVLGDLTGGQHVQGKAYIGGNLNGSLTVAQGNAVQGAAAGNYAALTVGGNAGSWKLESGLGGSGVAARIGGNSSGEAGINGTSASFIGHVDTGGTFNAQGFNANESKTVTTNVAGLAGSIATTTASLTSDLSTLSKTLAGLQSTAVADMSKPLSFGQGSYAVFSMTADQFNGLNVNFDTLFTAMPSGMSAIINVAGTSLIELGNLNSAALNQSVIWNFADATSLTLKGWHGSVLAPNATLINTSAIEGSVVAKSFIMGGEVHLGTYNGTSTFLPSSATPTGAVPEVETWVMMVAGFGALGLLMRRRARRDRPAASF